MALETLTTGQIAKHCGVNFRTVIRWIEKGRLKAYKLPGRGDNRVQVADFVEFLTANEMPIPEEFQSEISAPKILVVDDDTNMASAIRRVLVRQGYEVEVAHSGFEAGVRLSTANPRLVTLDLQMPGMDGLEVLALIRAEYGVAIRVLVVSAAGEQRLAEAHSAGADAVMHKPFDNDELIAAVQKLCPNGQ